MLFLVWLSLLAPATSFAQTPPKAAAETMTKMVVRLSGPHIAAGSFPALPKTIYRAGESYARIEDPPDAKQKTEKLMIVAGRDAYSVNVIDKTGTHVTNAGATHDLGLPIVLPFDPKHKLGKLDEIEFGTELEFFEQAGARKEAGPIINAKPTDAYKLITPEGPALLVVRGGTEVPVTLTWPTADGKYQYEYITYEDLPLAMHLFRKPSGIRFREIPPEPDAAGPGK